MSQSALEPGTRPLPSPLPEGEGAIRAASADFVNKIPIAFARKHGMLGLAGDGATLSLAVARLDDLDAQQVVARFLGRPVEPVLASADAIASAINVAYQQRDGQAATLIAGLEKREVLAELQELAAKEDLLDTASRAPVIRLVNLMLFEAVKQSASDVHVQPYEQTLIVRLRVDGVLFDAFDVPKGLQEEVIGRLKVMGKMNIAEKRLPQDGRASVQVGDRVIDLRIASLPTRFGERVVIRLLDKSRRLYSLAEIGMRDATLAPFRKLISSEHGILLVTGPTGSGKTTTLYAALQEIDSKQRNVITLEDPIEFGLDGVSQTQINEKKGMTFASGLRNVLRQDPDVIMVGEVRDRETAQMAIQSSLTGHLVFSTLHTNDAASAVTRLLDLGIEPYLVSSSVIGVIAQRLVRKICPACATPYALTSDDRSRLRLRNDVDATRVRIGVGCDECRNTGYQSRIGLFELLVVNDAIRAQIADRATAADVARAAARTGMRTLLDDGVELLLAGVTSVAEVARVTMAGEGDADDASAVD